jgi:hypothetical protein
MPVVCWNIGRQGRAWTGEEACDRWELTSEKFEMDRGKLFWDETQRLTLLALVLENVGADQAVRLSQKGSCCSTAQGPQHASDVARRCTEREQRPQQQVD